MDKIVLENINSDRFNPFNATPEELLVNALHDSGLLSEHTIVNGKSAENYLTMFFTKRSSFRDATLLGKMLLDTGKISHDKLKQALDYQKEHKGMKIGEALINLTFCEADDIKKCLEIQKEKRKDSC